MKRESGMVTAETAVALPAVVAVLCLGLWVVTSALAQLRCVDAARAGVLAASRGESAQTVQTVIRQSAPAGADVEIRRDGDRVVVVIRARVAPLGLPLPAVAVHASATASIEPGAR